MILPPRHESGFDRVITNIVNTSIPLGITAYPTIEPLPLPYGSGPSDDAPDGKPRTPFDSFHRHTQAGPIVSGWNQQSVPVVRHDRVVRNLDSFRLQRFQFLDYHTGNTGFLQRARSFSRIQVLLPWYGNIGVVERRSRRNLVSRLPARAEPPIAEKQRLRVDYPHNGPSRSSDLLRSPNEAACAECTAKSGSSVFP